MTILDGPLAPPDPLPAGYVPPVPVAHRSEGDERLRFVFGGEVVFDLPTVQHVYTVQDVKPLVLRFARTERKP